MPEPDETTHVAKTVLNLDFCKLVRRNFECSPGFFETSEALLVLFEQTVRTVKGSSSLGHRDRETHLLPIASVPRASPSQTYTTRISGSWPTRSSHRIPAHLARIPSERLRIRGGFRGQRKPGSRNLRSIQVRMHDPVWRRQVVP